MALKKIYSITIAKEKYDNSSRIQSKLSKEKWESFILANLDYYNWLENTNHGRTLYALFPDKPPKIEALAGFDSKRDLFKISVQFLESIGLINISISKPTIDRLEKLLDLANHMEAYLLINGTKIVTKGFLEKEKVT